MRRLHNAWRHVAKTRVTMVGCALLLSVFSHMALAQTSATTRAAYPDLADLFNAFDMTQARMFEDIASINADPAYAGEREALHTHLNTVKRMTMSEMMASGMMNYSGHVLGLAYSPYPEKEIESRIALIAVMRAKHDDAAVASAYAENAVISPRLASILRRGRDFENGLFDIFVDDTVTDKATAVEAAVAQYLSDDAHSVSPYPTPSRYLVQHPHASGFKTAFPRLSGFLWTQQWLQLAALEAVMLSKLEPQFATSMDTAMERFWNKIGTEGGMSMFPAPNELPMAPAIVPDLYSLSHDAALILDNLNILETVVADILSYPNEDNREVSIDKAIALLTSKKQDKSQPLDYLLFALRGGIYNQGGPAVGDLTRSERNRSRDAMVLQHAAVLTPGE